MTTLTIMRRDASTERMERMPSVEAYDLLSPDYDRIPNPMIALEQNAMLARVPAVGGRIVADLACGTGRYADRALAMGARRVYGLDRSPGMLSMAKRRLGADPRFRAALGDLEQLPFRAGSLDGVLCGLALGYASKMHRAVAEMSRVLKPGGFAVVSDLHPIGPSLGWEREYSIRSGGRRRRIAVQYYPYSFEQLFAALYGAGLFLETVDEVPVGDSLLGFARSWRDRRRLRRIREVPAVAILLARKEH